MPGETRARYPVLTPLTLSAQDAARIAYLASFGSGGSVGLVVARRTPASPALAAAEKGAPADPASFQAANPATIQVGHPATIQAAQALSRLGYAQIDTISVVERAHHHVLWSRVASYSAPVLDALQGEPRLAFEYWAHAAAYLPMEDYRFCLPRMRRIADEGHEWFPHDARMVEWVLDRIKAEGPLRSQDFESEGARGPWWDWKPAKAALEFLFQSGRLMVKARPGFQKLYDLSERVLPAGIDARYPGDEDMADWYVRRAALALGVFSARDLAYNRKDGKKLLADALGRACEEGTLLPARVRPEQGCAEGLSAKDESAWVDPRAYAAMESWSRSAYGAHGQTAMDDGASPAARAIRILSPFDNFIIDRKRSLRLLGLDYTLECYVPAAKRRFGYFSLPIFLYERPIGLLDCKADRKAGRLIIKRCELGYGADTRPIKGQRSLPKAYKGAFLDELKAFAAFNECGEWEWQS